MRHLLLLSMLGGLCLAATVQAQQPAPAPVTTPVPTPKQTQPLDAETGPAVETSAPRPAPRTTDRVDLDATQITGNQELPKVLYIVPWRRPELGDLAGKPLNSLLDEVLAPIDRDVFRRENRYFESLQGSGPAASPDADRPAPAAPAAAGTPRPES